MNIDDRARRAADSVRRAAARADVEASLTQVQRRAERRRWVAPAAAAAAAALLVAAIVVVPRLLGGPEAPVIRPVDGVLRTTPSATVSDPAPTASDRWRRVEDRALSSVEVPALLLDVASTGDRVVAFSTHMAPTGDDAFRSAGTDVWWSDDERSWTQETPTALIGEGRSVEAVAQHGDLLLAVVRRTPSVYDLYESADGRSWQQREQLPDGLAGGASSLMVTDLATGSAGVVVVANRVVADGEAAPTQPVVAIRGDTGWQVEELSEAGFDRAVDGVALVGDRIVAVGRDGTRGLLWQRTDTGWEVLDTPGPLQHVVATSARTMLAVGTVGADATVVDGRPVGWDLEQRRIDLGGVRLFDLTSVEGRAVAVGNTVTGGPQDRPAVVTLSDGDATVELLEGSGLLRGVVRHGGTLVAVGEAVDEGPEGGHVSRPAVWLGPVPGAVAPPTPSPSDRTSRAPAAGDASACDPSLEPVDEELPAAVRATRDAILDALRHCALAELVRIGERGEPVTVSFGGRTLSDAWIAEQLAVGAGGDADDPAPLDALGTLLTMPSGTVDTGDGQRIHVWPRLFAENDDEEARRVLVDTGLYTADALRRMDETIGGYVGWRVGITEEGDWIYLVAGD